LANSLKLYKLDDITVQFVYIQFRDSFLSSNKLLLLR